MTIKMRADGVVRCVHGHEMTPENTAIISTTGRMRCKRCKNYATKIAYAKMKAADEKFIAPKRVLLKMNDMPAARLRIHKKESCSRGHAFDPENTGIIKSTGKRVCLSCKKARDDIRIAKMPPEKKSKCAQPTGIIRDIYTPTIDQSHDDWMRNHGTKAALRDIKNRVVEHG